MIERVCPDGPPTLRSGLATSSGHRRRSNEDAALAGPVWFVVADGMGGHRDGAMASQIVIDRFRDDAARREIAASLPGRDDVDRIVGDAHCAVVERAGRPGEMGATVVGLGLVELGGEHQVAVFHVGDARCYRLVDATMSTVTVDHTHVQELIDAGCIAPQAARSHPLRNVVTRAVGVDLGGGVDLALLPVTPGRFLLCSDGLSGELEAAAIARVLTSVDDPQLAADRLVDMVLNGTAADNVTALVVDVQRHVAGLGAAGGTGWVRAREGLRE